MKDHLKGAWKSWTIRANAIFALIIAGLPMLQDSLPALQPYLNADWYRYAMGAVITANILLRFRTSCALNQK